MYVEEYMKSRIKKVFCQTVFAAGAMVWLTGCGLADKYEELKSVIVQEEVSSDKTEKPVRKKKPREQKETEVVLKPEETETEETETAEETETDDNTESDIASPQNYAYSALGEEAKQVYNEMLTTILEHQESVEVSTLDQEVMEEAYRAVMADYGGLYWVSGYVYTQYTRGGEPTSMEFSPKYTMELAERERIQRQIDASVEELLAGISITDSDYEKAKYVFEILVQNVDYDSSAENNQNIISAFLNRATVCQGYACATQYLLRLLGIESVIVTGNANGESHAWNLVRLDGEYYYMDTTWGNSRYLDSSSQMEKYVNYNYLAITSEEISRTHAADSTFPLPECSSMKNNYFVRENKYFSDWNPEAVGGVLAAAWNEGGDASVKFSSPELYDQALDYFITKQHIADYCENISSIYYLEDAELYVITFHFL